MIASTKQAIGAGALLVVGLLLALTACGGSGGTGGTTAGNQTKTTSPTSAATEFRPPGDIPDSQPYTQYPLPGTTVHLKVPAGWGSSTKAGVVTFSDHYNSVSIQVVKLTGALTPSSVSHSVLPALRTSVAKFQPGQVSWVQRQHGRMVRITYLHDSAADSVTGKVVRDASERYLLAHAGQVAVLTLTGPKNADNVDPWRKISNSLRWGAK